MREHLSVMTAVLFGLLASACDGGGKAAVRPESPQEGFPDWALGLYAPLPETNRLSGNPAIEAKVRLGRMLYNDELLSNGRDVSCNSCHPLGKWGTTTASAGNASRGSRLDVPSVYNASAEVDLFWDGRAHDVEEQAKGSLLNPLEMAMADETAVLARLRASPRYRDVFREVFPNEAEPVTFVNVAGALGAFERRLVTPARWDRFLRGDRNALSAAEKVGFETFVSKGCSDCHNGVAVGGRMFQVVGEVKPWPLKSDSGLYSVSRKRSDLFVFRVPSLRNVEMTSPYFDNGVVTDLSEAVRLMARYQRGMNLSDGDVEKIVTWLKTLTGDLPSQSVGAQTVAR